MAKRFRTVALVATAVVVGSCATINELAESVAAVGEQARLSNLPVQPVGDTLVFSGNLRSSGQVDEFRFEMPKNQRFSVWANTGYPDGTGLFNVALLEVNPVDPAPERWRTRDGRSSNVSPASEQLVRVGNANLKSGSDHWGLRIRRGPRAGVPGRYDIIVMPHRIKEVNGLRTSGEIGGTTGIEEHIFRIPPDRRFHVRWSAPYPGGSGEALLTKHVANSVDPLNWSQWQYRDHWGMRVRFSSEAVSETRLLGPVESGIIVVRVNNAVLRGHGRYDLWIELQPDPVAGGR